MADSIAIHFNGPYSFVEENNSLFECKYSESAGIYLWTKRSSIGYLICYVGQTANFSKRHKEHLIRILGLDYGIFSASAAREGRLEFYWKGLWRVKKGEKIPIAELIKNYQDPIFSSRVIEHIKSIEIFFAETEDLTQDIRKHIEGSIARNLRTQYPQYKVLYPDDNRTGVKRVKLNKKLVITSDQKILGLDSAIDL